MKYFQRETQMSEWFFIFYLFSNESTVEIRVLDWFTSHSIHFILLYQNIRKLKAQHLCRWEQLHEISYITFTEIVKFRHDFRFTFLLKHFRYLFWIRSHTVRHRVKERKRCVRTIIFARSNNHTNKCVSMHGIGSIDSCTLMLRLNC